MDSRPASTPASCVRAAQTRWLHPQRAVSTLSPRRRPPCSPAPGWTHSGSSPQPRLLPRGLPVPRSHPHMPPGRLLPFRSPTEAAHTAGPGGHHPPGQPKARAGLALLPATGLPLGRPEARAHLWAPLATASHCQARGHLCPRRGAAWPHHVHGPAPAPPTHRPSSAARVGLGTSKLPGRGGCRPCRAEVMARWVCWGPTQIIHGTVLAFPSRPLLPGVQVRGFWAVSWRAARGQRGRRSKQLVHVTVSG